jgi:hypothetical protein
LFGADAPPSAINASRKHHPGSVSMMTRALHHRTVPRAAAVGLLAYLAFGAWGANTPTEARRLKLVAASIIRRQRSEKRRSVATTTASRLADGIKMYVIAIPCGTVGDL